MALVNPQNIFDELMFALRNELVDPKSRGSDKTDSFASDNWGWEEYHLMPLENTLTINNFLTFTKEIDDGSVFAIVDDEDNTIPTANLLNIGFVYDFGEGTEEIEHIEDFSGETFIMTDAFLTFSYNTLVLPVITTFLWIGLTEHRDDLVGGEQHIKQLNFPTLPETVRIKSIFYEEDIDGETVRTYVNEERSEFNLATNPVFNIKCVEINGETLVYGKDYNVNMTATTCKVTLTTYLTTNLPIEITYHHTDTWIHTKNIRTDLTLSSYPRIALISTGHSNEPLGCKLEGLKSTFNYMIMCCFEGKANCKNMFWTIKQWLWANRLNFHYFSGILFSDIPDPVLDATRKNEIYTGMMGVFIPDQLQT